MEEKKEKIIKIKLNTMVYVSIIIILLVVVALLGIKINILNKKIGILNNQIETLKNENTEINKILKEELGEGYLETITTFDDIDELMGKNATNYQDDEINNFSEEQIKEAIMNYVQISELSYKSKSELLIELGLTNRGKIQNYEERLIGDEYYYVTNITFEEYKNAMLQYMTEDLLKDKLDDGEIRFLNGILYYADYPMYDDYNYHTINITKSENDNNCFNVELIGTIYYEDENLEEENEQTAIFYITSRNGKLVVESTDFY